MHIAMSDGVYARTKAYQGAAREGADAYFLPLGQKDSSIAFYISPSQVERTVPSSDLVMVSPYRAPCAGLYAERVGAINFVLADPRVAERVLSQIKRIARALWSNPPVHGKPCLRSCDACGLLHCCLAFCTMLPHVYGMFCVVISR